MNAIHYSRALGLAGRLYTAPICERLGVMKEILDEATNQDAGFRRILTDPKLLRASPDEKHLFHRRAPASYLTISQAANAYTQKFFGVSIQTYLEEAREGTIRENHEATRSANHGAVPKLSKIKNVRCWHKPLCAKKMEEEAANFEADSTRVDDIVRRTQARIDGMSEAA